MKPDSPILYYVHDPMCSWCWGFRPVWNQVQEALAGKVAIRYILGGLAIDSDQAMPEELQHTIITTWKNIQQEVPGIKFNYDFWTQCKPRRSTYPACRAIIACRVQQPKLESDMLLAIQQAYYLEAKNPSDIDVLIALADKLGLDIEQFAKDIVSDDCQNALMGEIAFCRENYVHSFPSLVLKQAESYAFIKLDYNDSDSILSQIHQHMVQHQKM